MTIVALGRLSQENINETVGMPKLLAASIGAIAIDGRWFVQNRTSGLSFFRTSTHCL